MDTMERYLRNYVVTRAPNISTLRAALKSLPTQDLLKQLHSIRSNTQETAVIIAADEGHTEVLRLLLTPLGTEAYSLLLRKEKDGEAALHKAARRGHAEAVQLLVDAVVPEKVYMATAAKNQFGKTPFIVAAANGNTECVETLLCAVPEEQKFNLMEIQDEDMYTALHFAAYYGYTDVINSILTAVPSRRISTLLNIEDCNHTTPLRLAEWKERTEATEMLLSWQNKPLEEERNSNELLRRLEDLERQFSLVRAEKEQQSQHIKEQNTRIQALEMQIGRLLNNQLNADKEKLNEQGRQLDEQRRQHDEQGRQRDELVTLVKAQISEENISLVNQLKRAEQRLHEQEKQIDEMRRQLDEQRKRYAETLTSTKSLKAHNKKLSEELNSLVKQLGSAETKVNKQGRQLGALEGQLNATRIQLAAQQEQHDIAGASLRSLVRELASHQAAAEAQIFELITAVSEWFDQIESTKMTLEEFKGDTKLQVEELNRVSKDMDRHVNSEDGFVRAKLSSLQKQVDKLCRLLGISSDGLLNESLNSR